MRYDHTPENHPNYERQVALEAEMVSRGTLAYKKATGNAKANGRSQPHHAVRTLCGAIKPVADAIREFMRVANSGTPGRKHVAAKYLRQVSPDMAAFMALRTCLNMVSGKVALQNAAITIANALETEVRLVAFEQANIDEYRKPLSLTGLLSSLRHARIWRFYPYAVYKNL